MHSAATDSENQSHPQEIVAPVRQVLARWTRGPQAGHFCHHEVLPARPARTEPLPDWVDPRLKEALRARGVVSLYTHQAQAVRLAREAPCTVVATPTASGKTLCYNLPVLQALLQDPTARALYLFPTKALARDQVQEARALASGLGDGIGVSTVDGDTPPSQRRAARDRGRIIATNPEMLHVGLLPNHPAWAALLSGLRYVVIDELHTYRGVFGSHLANVLRRLQRVAAFHGAHPRFVAASATIANPGELAQRLTGAPARCVTESGAPCGERHFLIYNPPVVDEELGLREDPKAAAGALCQDLLRHGVGTLLFCRSRLDVEVMVRQLQDRVRGLCEKDQQPRAGAVRGGYLPQRRREVEHALRQGTTDVVVATSALELGIDIGGLDAVLMVGWPGSRAAAWQRAGRAGRRLGPSLAVLVASSAPVDQFVAGEPAFLFGQAPEHARVNADNPAILVPHLKCAAAELPFVAGEAWAGLSAPETAEVLGCLAEAGLLHRDPAGGHRYVGHTYPAAEVSLRGPLDANYLVVRAGAGDVLAEVDYNDAPQVLHEQAIYQVEGRLFHVDRLDHQAHKAHVTEVAVDYFTDAMVQTVVRVLERTDHDRAACHGEVHVVQRVVGFKPIKLHTGENIGFGEVHQPEREMHTTGFWVTADAEGLGPLRGLGGAEVAQAALAAARTLHTSAALLLMSDTADLGRAVGDARSGWFAVAPQGRAGKYSRPGGGADAVAPTSPVIYLFDQFPGGTGLSPRLYEQRAELLAMARRAVEACPCPRGCPACVGPARKQHALALLRALALRVGEGG